MKSPFLVNNEEEEDDLFLYLSNFTSAEQSQLWSDLSTSKLAKLTISLRGYAPMMTTSRNRHPLWGNKRGALDDLVDFVKSWFGYTSYCSEFALALKRNSNLHTLDLTLSQLSLHGAQELAEVLMENQTLQCLNLSDNHLGNRGCEALAYGLQRNNTLRKLNVSSNFIDQIHHLTRALMRNTMLQELNFACNRIDLPGSVSLSDLLMVNGTLQVLCLECTQLGDSGVQQIGWGLQHNNTLRMLDLSHNEIRDSGARYLAAAAAQQQLNKLNLFGNHVGDSGAQALLEMFAKNHAWYEVNLDANLPIRAGLRAQLRVVSQAKRLVRNILILRSACVLQANSALRKLPCELCAMVFLMF